jgi:FimV-like protein
MKHQKLAVITGLLLAAFISLQPVNAGSYGPVKNNDTLWDIASRNRPSYDISVPQMMAAIQASNPHAFFRGDINHLRKGVYLKIPVMPEVRQSAGKQASQASLQAEISSLRTQLQEEQGRSAKLAEQLKQLQAASPAAASPPAQQDQVAKLQTELAELKQQLQARDVRIAELQAAAAQVAALPEPTAGQPGASAEQAKQADAAMQAELAELKQLLEQRDTHIQNLQASLREASISIKRQYAETQALHAQLKALEPGSTVAALQPPAEPGSATPPRLVLIAPQEPADSTPVFTDQLTAPPATADGKVQGDEKPVSLQNMLEQQVTGSEDGKLPTPSRVSLVIALVSLMFILALLWRSFSQRRALNQEEARLRAELEG